MNIELEPNERRVRTRYNQINQIWEIDDSWHQHSFKSSRKLVSRFFDKAHLRGKTVLNLGSGDTIYDYGATIINLDLAEKKLVGLKNAVCGSAHNIPIKTSSVDAVVCAGSVINYCNAEVVFFEIARVLKSGGYCYLEYERSGSFEYLGSQGFMGDIAVVSANYAGAKEVVWAYGDSFIHSMINRSNMQCVRQSWFHIISPMIFKLTKAPRISAKFGIFDPLLNHCYLTKWAGNFVVICKKNGMMEAQ